MKLTCPPQAPSVEMRVRHLETDDEEEQVCRRADHQRSAWAGRRRGDGGGLPAAQDQDGASSGKGDFEMNVLTLVTVVRDLIEGAPRWGSA